MIALIAGAVEEERVPELVIGRADAVRETRDDLSQIEAKS